MQSLNQGVDLSGLRSELVLGSGFVSFDRCLLLNAKCPRFLTDLDDPQTRVCWQLQIVPLALFEVLALAQDRIPTTKI